MTTVRSPGWVRAGLTLVLAALLTGCWDRREVTEIALVAAVALDRTPGGQVQLSLEVVIPNAIPGPGGGGQTGPPFILISAEAGSVGEAVQKLQQSLPRRIFWGHNRVFLLGEDLARAGAAPYLAYFIRDPRVRFSAALYVVRGQAAQLLTVRTTLEPLSGETLEHLLMADTLPQVRLRDFFVTVQDQGITPVAPRAELRSVATPGETAGEEVREIALGGLGVFEGDRLVGWLESGEAWGLSWAGTGYRQGPRALFPLQGLAGREGLLGSAEILHARGRVRPEWVNGRLQMTWLIDVELALAELNQPLDAGEPEVVAELERGFAREIQAASQRTLERARQLRTDIFGFGRAVHRRAPQIWHELAPRWSEIFPELPVRIEVATRIRRIGKVQKGVAFPRTQTGEGPAREGAGE